MKRSMQMAVATLVASTALGATLAITTASATTPPTRNPTIISLQAVVDGKSYNVRPAQPITVKAGETFTMTLVGTVVDADGKVTRGVPVDAIFSTKVDARRVDLSSPTANGTDVTVHQVGRHGDFVQYKVTPVKDVNIRTGLATGYIGLR
jgi:hypothetical protein